MPNIIASYWSVAGDRFPGCGDEASPFSFRDRYETAGRLGFAGAGLVHDDLIRARDTIGYGELSAILKANGIVDLEVEILSDWFADGDRRRASDAMRRDLLEAGEKLGARHLKVSGDFHTPATSLDRMAEDFAGLCRDAAEVGLPVGIEVMPFTNLSSLEAAMQVVTGSGAKNGGVLLDLWHMERGKVDFAAIARLPKEAIISIEIDDAAPDIVGDLWNDTLHHRRACGEGCFDIPGFLKAVAATGYDGPVGVEIIAADHRKLPLAAAAARTMDSVRRFVPEPVA